MKKINLADIPEASKDDEVTVKKSAKPKESKKPKVKSEPLVTKSVSLYERNANYLSSYAIKLSVEKNKQVNLSEALRMLLDEHEATNP